MDDFEVKIVTLPPMQAASFHGYGPNPEELAHEEALKWLKNQDLLKEDAFRHFGFNNPNPSAGSPNYGYEIWLIPTNGLPSDHNAKKVAFAGGLYAVAYCPSLEVISEVWQKLVAWRDTSEYEAGSHQWLEEIHQPWNLPRASLQFDLYLPLKG